MEAKPRATRQSYSRFGSALFVLSVLLSCGNVESAGATKAGAPSDAGDASATDCTPAPECGLGPWYGAQFQNCRLTLSNLSVEQIGALSNQPNACFSINCGPCESPEVDASVWWQGIDNSTVVLELTGSACATLAQNPKARIDYFSGMCAINM